MTDIQTLIAQLSARQQQQAPQTAVRNAPGQGNAAADQGASPDRTVKDTVTLSDSGQKIVNLARGYELADEIRKAPVDKGFFASLGKALGDVFRIGRLFLGTIKAAFAQSRK